MPRYTSSQNIFFLKIISQIMSCMQELQLYPYAMHAHVNAHEWYVQYEMQVILLLTCFKNHKTLKVHTILVI